MTSDAEKTQLLRLVPTEVEATILVARLAEARIEAWIEGGLSAGFRAEAPGGARVLVHRRDLERAGALLQEERPAPPAPAAPPTRPGPLPRERALAVWAIVLVVLIILIFLGSRLSSLWVEMLD